MRGYLPNQTSAPQIRRCQQLYIKVPDLRNILYRLYMKGYTASKVAAKCISVLANVRYTMRLRSESWSGIGSSPSMSVMRRWRAFCGRGLDLVHARLGPVLRQSRRYSLAIVLINAQFFFYDTLSIFLINTFLRNLTHFLLNFYNVLSANLDVGGFIDQLLRPRLVQFNCSTPGAKKWSVCLCRLLALLLRHLLHQINHLQWNMC